MRWIEKPNEPPPAIRDYLAAQTPVGHGLDYETFASTGAPQGGSRGRQLCRDLTAAQWGLCAYTGAGIDERLGQLANPNGNGQDQTGLRFKSHNEHLKPQSVCRAELVAAGGVVGCDLGEDMDHRNIVAALLVSGGNIKVSKEALFGASHRENDPVPVLPTDPTCEQRFAFNEWGDISAANPTDQAAVETIAVLNLQNGVLKGWRENAIQIFLEGVETREDAEQIIAKTTTPENGRLPEYCFAIRQVVQSMLPPAV